MNYIIPSKIKFDTNHLLLCSLRSRIIKLKSFSFCFLSGHYVQIEVSPNQLDEVILYSDLLPISVSEQHVAAVVFFFKNSFVGRLENGLNQMEMRPSWLWNCLFSPPVFFFAFRVELSWDERWKLLPKSSQKTDFLRKGALCTRQ